LANAVIGGRFVEESVGFKVWWVERTKKSSQKL